MIFTKGKTRIISVILICIFVGVSMVFPSPSLGKTTSSTYWLKVNTKCNVVNVYRKESGAWKPFKVMLCSCGLGTNADNSTPKGTYKMKSKWRWLALVANSYGQYNSQITGDYLFHSVPYTKRYDHSSQKTKEFNKLGKRASHGCVRLSCMDAKWIYENCPRGTKITVYSSDKAGPLGKPTGIKVSTKKKLGWDPTDKFKGNPNYSLPSPIIQSKTADTIQVEKGTKVKLLSLVKAKDPNTFRDLTKLVKIKYIKKYNIKTKRYEDSKFSTSIPGKYKVRYGVYNKYCGSGYLTMKIIVTEPPEEPLEPTEDL